VVEGFAPAPVRVTNCGEPVALSAMLSDAVRVPVAAGLNSTEIVQLAPGARVAPQVDADSRNDVALVPSMDSEVKVRAVVPVFLTVTTCAADVEPSAVDAKVSADGETVTVGGTAAPIPVRVTV
jgi:hypothetical protein